MKALVKKHAEAGLWMTEVPVPTIGDHEILIKVKKAAICGTDINIYKWGDWAQKNVAIDTTIGHEFIGEVTELGRGVTSFKIGDRVTGESHVLCGHCRNCRTGNGHNCVDAKVIGVHRNGCFAEYLSLPAFNTFHVPDAIPDEIAAIFDPLGNATHTALSFSLVGEDVLITGAGPIGLMAISICKYAGARNVFITDINNYRLDLAKKMGATEAINVNETRLEDAMANAMAKRNIAGFTVCLEMAGNGAALETILKNAFHGAHVGLLGILPPGIVIDWDLVIFKGLHLLGIFGRKIFDTWYKMSNMIEGGLDISKVITHRFSADDFQKGFDAMLSGSSGKITLDWS